MKIAFDGQLLLGKDRTGIAWNAHNLILELAKDQDNECTIQYFKSRHTSSQRLEEYQRAGCRAECCSWFRYVLYKYLWLVFPVPYRIFFHTRPDITQFFNFTVPPGVRGKRIVFIHDLAYRACPQTVGRKTRVWLELSMKKSCRHADHIVTVSKFSKREIMKYLHVPKEKITVVPNAVDHTVYHADYTQEQIQKVQNKLGIEREYFLYLGTIEPRKNLERLICAYARLCGNKKQVPQLVLAGRRGWLCDGIYQKARELDPGGNNILFTGYVSQEDSPILMCGARAFVFPSLYEGFGMPPLEAMACGTPVITSNVTALPEVVADAGITVDPKSEVQICQAMKKILEDDSIREKYQKLGQQRASKYTWKHSARRLSSLYQTIMPDAAGPASNTR